MCIYENPILVTLDDNDRYIALRTYDEKHGRSQRFFLSKEALTQERSVTECDLQNVCTVTHCGKDYLFRLYWLHGNCDDGLYGYQQSFSIPEEKITSVLTGKAVKHLAYTPHKKARIFFTKPAHEAIAETDKLARHALRRFFRDQFNYDEDIIVQRDSLVKGFYFFSTMTSYEGGIVPHERSFKSQNGMSFRKVIYGLHT